jgi:hypothetical protein
MKITIYEKVCTKHKMTPVEVLFALAFRISKGDTLSNMLAREILVDVGGQMQVTQHWSDVLDEIIAESGGCTKSEDELKELAKKMIEAYPHGAMIDRRTGKLTTYFFQCNNPEVRAKLKSFYARYGEYPDEDILDAEKRYVARWNGNYQQMGFRQLKYFIFKKDKDTGEISSPLLDFLENKESEGEEVINGDILANLV